MRTAMLTTDDNPFDPFTQWYQWYEYDESHGYHSSEYLARVVRTSPELSTELSNQAIEDAIDDIVRFNLTDGSYSYRKIINDS
jgi:hypothetical protein